MDKLTKIKLAYVRDVLATSTGPEAEKAYLETHQTKEVDPLWCLGWMNGGVKEALKVLVDLLNEI